MVTFQTPAPLARKRAPRSSSPSSRRACAWAASSRGRRPAPGPRGRWNCRTALELKERRGQPRARLNPKEGTTLTALTGLFEGVGITGVVENLSGAGARIRVEKAMSLKGEKRLPLGTGLVPAGPAVHADQAEQGPQVPRGHGTDGRAVFLDAVRAA